MNRTTAIVVFTMMLVSGCGKAPEPRQLAVVNGKAITDAYLRDVVRVQAKISELSGKKVSDEPFQVWGNKRADEIFPSIVTGEILAQAIEKAGIVPESNDIQRVFAKYNKLTRQKASTPEELFNKFGELSDEFKVQFERSCLLEAYGNHFNNPGITDEEVEELIWERDALAKFAVTLDKKGKENANKAWERLKAGEVWDIVAEECSEDRLVNPQNEDFKNLWGIFGPDGLGYPALAAALPNLNPGDYSMPIDVDEGLIIVKVLERGHGYWKLARMLFRMAEPVTVPTAEVAREEIRDRKAADAKKGFMERARNEAEVTYPAGTNFNFRVFD